MSKALVRILFAAFFSSIIGATVVCLTNLNARAKLPPTARVQCVIITGQHYASGPAGTWFLEDGYYRSREGDIFTPPHGSTCTRSKS